MACGSKRTRYRRWDVGRKGHHYLQVAYKDGKLMETKLKAYKGSGEKEITIWKRGRSKRKSRKMM